MPLCCLCQASLCIWSPWAHWRHCATYATFTPHGSQRRMASHGHTLEQLSNWWCRWCLWDNWFASFERMQCLICHAGTSSARPASCQQPCKSYASAPIRQSSIIIAQYRTSEVFPCTQQYLHTSSHKKTHEWMIMNALQIEDFFLWRGNAKRDIED